MQDSLSRVIGSSEPPRLVLTLPGHKHLSSWSPDEEWLAVDDLTLGSVRLVNLVDTTRSIFLEVPSSNGAFSPDGRWLAYQSSESGTSEVFVAPMGGLGTPEQVSRGGGSQPHWGDTASELYFRQARSIMRARRASDQRVTWDAPVALFDAGGSRFSVGPGGRTFYVVGANPDDAARDLFVVQNWLASALREGAAAASP
jgi:Tol biopolymer transport system component